MYFKQVYFIQDSVMVQKGAFLLLLSLPFQNEAVPSIFSVPFLPWGAHLSYKIFPVDLSVSLTYTPSFS
jgi:hypothetical protein